MRDTLATAAETVADLPEHLQVAAFQEILKLSFGTAPYSDAHAESSGEKGSSRRRRSTRPKAITRHKKAAAASADDASPTIDLTVEQLKQLREFIQGLVLNGEEQTVFAAAMFLHESLHVDEFSIADLELCYRRLLSMRVKLPVVKDFRRACAWLVAPSRKKEWLVRTDTGFGISNAGLVAFQELAVDSNGQQ